MNKKQLASIARKERPAGANHVHFYPLKDYPIENGGEIAMTEHRTGTIVAPSPDSVEALYSLLHEYGHIVYTDLLHTKPIWFQEYKCERYAQERLLANGIEPPAAMVKSGKLYITEQKGREYPPEVATLSRLLKINIPDPRVTQAEYDEVRQYVLTLVDELCDCEDCLRERGKDGPV